MKVLKNTCIIFEFQIILFFMFSGTRNTTAYSSRLKSTNCKKNK